MTNARVLVVDDNPENGLNLKMVLEKNGFIVSWSESAKDTLDILTTDTPDILLLDVVLPDIPGTELCKALKKENRFSKIPVILISGMRVSEEDYQIGLQCGATDYLFRPVSNDLLISKIKDILSAARDVDDQAAADREMLSLEGMRDRTTRETSSLFNSAPLRELYPESFQNSVAEYNLLIELALREKFYKVESTLAERLYKLSENLGFLNAGAKDIMDIHLSCLKTKIAQTSLKQQKIILEESRILLIGIMGNLINHYRRKSF